MRNRHQLCGGSDGGGAGDFNRRGEVGQAVGATPGPGLKVLCQFNARPIRLAFVPGTLTGTSSAEVSFERQAAAGTSGIACCLVRPAYLNIPFPAQVDISGQWSSVFFAGIQNITVANGQ